jgi:poly(A) polymerase
MAIVRTLREAGHAAFFAGGCVRDELLRLAPTDYDVATDATPDRIRRLFHRTNEVGAAFGVVLVTVGAPEGAPGTATVEVATFRSEGPYSDRRRPDTVSFSDPRSDALRRDFTINALLLDPLPAGPLPESLDGAAISPHPDPAKGRIIDLVGGLEDLAARRLRAVGDPDQRLAEDHLRALRAVRLSARLGFEIDGPTASAIHRHARALAGVSRERIGDELRRMMAHPSRAAAAGQLQSLGLDAPVLEESPRSAQPHALAHLGTSGPPPSLGLCLAAWAVDRGLQLDAGEIAGLARRWRKALCLSNDESADLRDILTALRACVHEWDGAAAASQKRLAGSAPGFDSALRILGAIDPARAAAISARVEALARTPSGLRPEPLVTGDDLVALGMKPGPPFKRLLDDLYDAQLEGRIQSRDQAMELARWLGV